MAKKRQPLSQYTLSAVRQFAEKYEGRAVRVVFYDPFWFRAERSPQVLPTLEVYGRLRLASEYADVGFQVMSLDHETEELRELFGSVCEGQMVYYGLVKYFQLLDGPLTVPDITEQW